MTGTTDPVDLFWERARGPLAHGVNDCCVTLADVILAAGGPDLMAEYRGRYRTPRGFVRAHRAMGHSDVTAAIMAAFTRHGRPVAEPRDFDVGMIGLTRDAQRVGAPAFHHSGLWLLRTDSGGAAVTDMPDRIFRVI